uniref:Disease resistance R13L4/SHOC-2-like LRR domain-containing protein n=1 Tax=Fagus sylvatica TaxID=28930 RepID=A0A2N9J0H9_FAGSY
MHSSTDKQTNPGETLTLPEIVDAITKSLNERLDKLKASVETTPTTTTTTIINTKGNSTPKQEVSKATEEIKSDREYYGSKIEGPSNLNPSDETTTTIINTKGNNTPKKEVREATEEIESDREDKSKIEGPNKLNPSDNTTTTNTSTDSGSTSKQETSNTTKKEEDSNKNTYSQVEKLHKNLKQIKDSLTQLQKFEESDLGKQLRNYLPNLKDRLEKNKNEATSDTNASSSLQNICKEVMKLKYQIPSLRKLSELDSSSTNLQTSNGSNVKSEIHGLVNPHKSDCFRYSSFYREIKEIFDGFNDKKKFFLSCFAALPENAVVKRRLLTYWGLGEGFLKESDSTTTPEKDVDAILEEFQEMGLIEPATKKRKLEIKSYKMDPLMLMAVNVLSKKDGFFQERNEADSSSKTKRAFLVKREEKSSEHGVPQSENLDQDEVVTLFNLNELSLDVESLLQLSKMKKVKVVYLGRWQKSASHHILLKNTALLDGLKSMKELKFLSLRGMSRINKLPGSIGQVDNLVILDLKDCHNLEELPAEIGSLKKLTYLDISNCYLLSRLPKRLSSLSKLQVLKGFLIGSSGNTLEDLKEMKKLVKLTIIATRNDFPTRKDLHALQHLEELQKLTISWGSEVKPPKSTDQQTQSEGKKMEQMENLPEKLDLHWFPGKLIPWLKPNCLPKSTHQQTQSEGEKMEQIEKLPEKIEKLDLHCFPGKHIPWLKPDCLRKLKKLYIRGGKLTTLEKGEWTVETLRLKYLTEMKTNWIELVQLFPNLLYYEKVKCPWISLCPCDENGVWLKS